MNQQKTILHIDFDSFFASCEQQFHPQFRGKPLGVTATNGRTCIIASSREAKALGIKTATRTFDAQAIYPDIVLTPANFVRYMEISKQFLAIAKDYSPYVEMFSIDEVFIDVTKTANLFGGVEGLIRQIKQRIHKQLGEYITVSIGISHNKLLAKLASGLKKPNGVMFIHTDEIEQVYKSAKLTDICGIGERIKRRLYRLGVFTLLQLRDSPLFILQGEFGLVEGRILKNIGQGIDDSPVVPYTTAPTVKSVGRNYCLPHNEYNQRVILQNVYELCEEVAIKLRRLGKKARTFGLYLRGSQDINGRTTTSVYVDSGREMFDACLRAIEHGHSGEEQTRRLQNPCAYRFWTGQNDYTRQISVWASHLEDKHNIPLALFEDSYKKDRLTQAIDILNDKFGDHTIRNGFLLYADKLTTVPNGWGADRYERTQIAVDQTLQ